MGGNTIVLILVLLHISFCIWASRDLMKKNTGNGVPGIAFLLLWFAPLFGYMYYFYNRAIASHPKIRRLK